MLRIAVLAPRQTISVRRAVAVNVRSRARPRNAIRASRTKSESAMTVTRAAAGLVQDFGNVMKSGVRDDRQTHYKNENRDCKKRKPRCKTTMARFGGLAG